MGAVIRMIQIEQVVLSNHPHQAVPRGFADRFGIIKCRGTPHVQSLDNRLGSDIVRRGISEHFLQLHPLKDIPHKDALAASVA
jgi:hypothetical protein